MPEDPPTQKKDDKDVEDLTQTKDTKHGAVDMTGKAGTSIGIQTALPLSPVSNEMKIEVDTSRSDEGNRLDEHSISRDDEMNSSIATLRPEGSEEKESMMSRDIPESITSVDVHTRSDTARSEGLKTPESRNRSPSNAQSPARSDAGFDEKHPVGDDERGEESRSEIKNIMDQFDEEGGGPGEKEVMSPRLEFAGPLLGAPVQYPPRKSSLGPVNQTLSSTIDGLENLQVSSNATSVGSDEVGPQVPPKMSPSLSRTVDKGVAHSMDAPMSPSATSLHRPPPPEPEPEPDLPFDFHRFLEQLRHRSADPVAKFLRSFLAEFGKKQWMVHEQVKIISDFLAFISNKMAQCDIWREVSDAEFDNAREGMEKLVMNRLYTQTFSPAIPARQPLPANRSTRRRNAELALGPGRRGQHQEDVERDEVLAQKVSIYGWVQEEHLDIQPVGSSGKRFLILAQQELLKIKTYRAPRDKIICVLNCCKVIFGLLKHSKSDSSADSFMPLLIYVILQANPEHMVSNVQYILRFRNQEKLGGEAGYYLSSLSGAVQFIENLDRTTLTITDEEFESHVEAAVSAIAEKHQATPAIKPEQEKADISEKRDLSRPSTSSRPSFDGEASTTQNPLSSDDEDPASLSGMLRTIQRPLSSIGRIFSDDSSSRPPRTPEPGHTPHTSQSPARQPSREQINQARDRHSAEEAAARQASAETAEAQRLERAEHDNVVTTLSSMFPDLDRDIISDVVREKHGRVAPAVDACLALHGT